MFGPKTFETEQEARQYLKDKGAAVIMDQDEANMLYGYGSSYGLVGAVKFKEFSGSQNPFYS